MRARIFFAFGFFVSTYASAATFQVLYSFAPGIGPAASDVGLILDQSGLLYGVISASPALPDGAIFRLDPARGVLTTLYVFTGGGGGAMPQQTLVFDQAGLLYGTTEFGGDANCEPGGCGTVFRLDPVTQRLTTLHAFADFATEGAYPASGALVFGPGGALFGSTPYGGTEGVGTVYSIGAAGGALQVLSSFSNGPAGALVVEADGTIYGATSSGGQANAGTLFSLAPPLPGQNLWALATVYSFSGGRDGGYPYAGLISGRAGALYGATEAGGYGASFGTAFQFLPSNGSFRTIRRFSAADGTAPYAPLVVDAKRNLYGVAPTGGALPRHCTYGCGTVFELGNPGWAATVLHEFSNDAGGKFPQSPLAIDAKGNLYGTAQGGHGGGGIIFEVSP